MVTPQIDKYGDLPIPEIIQMAQGLIESGCIVHFKFTCEKCGARQTFEAPNRLYERGICEECEHITKIKKAGLLVVRKI